jgi:molybdopterin molybdotransferase
MSGDIREVPTVTPKRSTEEEEDEPGAGPLQTSTGPVQSCTLAEAWSLIDERLTSLPQERVATVAAAGRRLARPAVAVASVPGFRRAAMDGFAIRSEDACRTADGQEVALKVVGVSLPGRPFTGTLGPGECTAIATGAVVPNAADTLVRWESVTQHGETILIRRPVEARKDVAQADEDIPSGSVIVSPPRTLRPQDVAACCSAGLREIDVTRIPRVGILATGDELVRASATPGIGRIVDSNSLLLRCLVDRDGGQAIAAGDEESGILPDDFDLIRSAIAALVERVDCLLVSGGTSHGRGDHTVAVLRALGTIVFRGVRIRPAAPAAFAMIRDVPVVLLPGNPVACLFAYDLFARRAIRILGSRNTDLPYPRRTLRLSRAIRSPRGILEYVRVRASGQDAVEPVRPRGASILSSTVTAVGFVLVPEEVAGYETGQSVEVNLYDSAYLQD